MNADAREEMLYNTITDDELRMPVGQLPGGRSFVIEHVLRGPLGEQLMERIRRLSEDTDE